MKYICLVFNSHFYFYNTLILCVHCTLFYFTLQSDISNFRSEASSLTAVKYLQFQRQGKLYQGISSCFPSPLNSFCCYILHNFAMYIFHDDDAVRFYQVFVLFHLWYWFEVAVQPLIWNFASNGALITVYGNCSYMGVAQSTRTSFFEYLIILSTSSLEIVFC